MMRPMTSTGVERVPYDEFGMFADNAREVGLPYDGPPTVERRRVEVAPGREVSALVWGTEPAELVLVHGGAQNAHTWDTVALALGRPLVAIDLPGHGHSDWREEGGYNPRNMADDLAVAIRALAPDAQAVVGMSMGGMTSICLAARHPELVRKLVVVDVTPGTDREKAKAIIDFISGPQSFPSFADILARTIEHNPTRSESSLRRGILHNARQEDDGSWVWRYDRRSHRLEEGAEPPRLDHTALWDDVSAVKAPMLLVRGGISPVVGDEDVAELQRRQPTAEVVVVEGAGHSIQGDKPVELAAIIQNWALA
jgi:pimeloyl-ACP methyl ester carboxylesterase